MQPGRPVLFGNLQNTPVFGLPGNPVSCMVAFQLFVRPLLLKMMGYQDFIQESIKAELEEDLEKKNDVRVFLRGKLTNKNGRLFVKRTITKQGSHILTSFHHSNCLIVFPEEEKQLSKGMLVDVMLN